VSTLKLAAATAVASLVALVPASTAVAQSYEDPAIDVDVNPTTLVGGGSFSGTATSNGVICDWTISFPGQPDVTGRGTSISFTFETDEVDEETEEDLEVKCEYDDENTPQTAPSQAGAVNVAPASYSTSTLPTAIQELERIVVITLLPEGDDDDDDDGDDGDGDGDGDGDDDNGGLPDTGGVDQTTVLTGVVLLAVGTGVVFMARRRRDGTA
jgi:LPXTG-motif cell wall-anchored protein